MNIEDFTVRLTRKQLTDYVDSLQSGDENSMLCKGLKALSVVEPSKSPDSYRLNGLVQATVGNQRKKSYRCLICRCAGNTAYSATFRVLKDTVETETAPMPTLMLDGDRYEWTADWPETKYHARSKRLFPTAGGYLFGPEHIVPALCDDMSRHENGATNPDLLKTPLEGLLVISGRTSTGKSRIAEGLIDVYLKSCHVGKPSRRPHLVTLQDPIENSFETADGLVPQVDYTPRSRGLDFLSLDDAIDDALRQTPTVLYIGEIRRPQEWKSVLRFAGTGHFCVVTTHAGSLVETMRALMEATEVKAADQRSSLANKLFALIHLKACLYRGPDDVNRSIGAVHPSMWLRSDRSLTTFVSDGLASILPHRNASNGGRGVGSLGRRHFADKLIKVRKDDFSGDERYSDVFLQYQRFSTALDLKGE